MAARALGFCMGANRRAQIIRVGPSYLLKISLREI